jgi:hypothetical protein
MDEQKEDLKEAISLAPGADQPEKELEKEVETETKEVEETSEVEDISILPTWAQHRLTKEQEEKENYRKMALKYKTRSLEPDKEIASKEEVEETPTEWDETSIKFQKETISRAERIAEKKANEMVEKSNEQTAISQFIASNPELEDEAQWKEVVSNYYSRNGKGSVPSILSDLNKAYIVTRYEKGEITKTEAVKEEKKNEAAVADLNTVSKSQVKSIETKGTTTSEGALKLAQRMKVDPKKLAVEDDSKTAEIKF